MAKINHSFVDLTGQVFGRLTVLNREQNNERGNSRWLCQCECGKRKVIGANSLRIGSTRSCGCLRRELVSALGETTTTHGLARSREYQVWDRMIQRCENPRHHQWHNYGERGIAVCRRWRESFEDFYADMGPRPSPQHSIDRIDNNGPYTPENCRWATRSEQGRNKRNNRMITFHGETKSVVEWAEITGIHDDTLSWRLKQGWPIEKVFSSQDHSERRIQFNGEIKSVSQWAKDLGIAQSSLWQRLEKWTVEKALTAPIKKHSIST